MKTYYMSFVDEKSRIWLGGAFVDATSPTDSVRRAWSGGFNPGGEVLIAEGYDGIGEEFKNRLLTVDEVDAASGGHRHVRREDLPQCADCD